MTTLSHDTTARRTLSVLAAVTLGTTATVAGAQDCRLDYQRPTASAVEQLTLGADQVQERAAGTTTTTLANRGSAPLAIALVGAPIAGVRATAAGVIVKALGGALGGVVNDRGSGPSTYGGLAGGVINTAERAAARGASWIILQPGQRLDGLRHDLAAVACGSAGPIGRAIVTAGAAH